MTVLLLAAKARSFLFVPGHQPERYSKALGSGADMVILDLEDSVGPADKPAARESIAAAWSSHADQRDRLLVRLNPDSTPFHKADLDLLASLPGLRGIMVPKAENSQLFAGIAAAFPSVYLLPMVESAEGMARIDEIARAPSVARIGVGHIDLQADLGMSCNEDEVELGPMRFSIVMASRRANIAPRSMASLPPSPTPQRSPATHFAAVASGSAANYASIHRRYRMCTQHSRLHLKKSSGRSELLTLLRTLAVEHLASTARWSMRP